MVNHTPLRSIQVSLTYGVNPFPAKALPRDHPFELVDKASKLPIRRKLNQPLRSNCEGAIWSFPCIHH
jgi:hypothetical protein